MCSDSYRQVWRGAALFLIAGGITLGCSSPPPPPPPPPLELASYHDLEFLRGRLVSGQEVLVAPDSKWRPHPDGRHWSFKGRARLVCFFGADQEQDFVMHFLPDSRTSEQTFQLFFDQDEVPFLTGKPDPEGTRIRIPAARLTAGAHTLRLMRMPDEVQENDQVTEPQLSGFLAIGYGLGEVRHQLRMHESEHRRFRYLADFLTLGLAGGGRRKLSGCLFDGPQRLTASLDLDEAKQAVLQVENFSRRRASFSFVIDGHRQSRSVAASPRPEAEWILDLPAGHHTVALEVDGRRDGLFLWGIEYLGGKTAQKLSPVILVTMDTTRRDVLSPYGGPHQASPTIGLFADQAHVYDNAHATAPWTLPTHASIFTGLYPGAHGAGVSHDRLRQSHTTLAEALRNQGYLTAGFAGGYLCSFQRGVGQGFSVYTDPEGSQTRGDRLTDAVLALIEAHHDKPLFLFVNYFDPHFPYQPPPELAARFNLGRLKLPLNKLPLWQDLIAGDTGPWAKIIAGGAEINPDVLAYLRAAYLAEVAFMDQQIARLFAALKRHDMYETALIVLVADHGEFLGEHGFFSHSCRLDPELTEIPLLIKWPGQTAGQRVSELVSQVDLFSTILARIDGDEGSRDGLRMVPGKLAQLASRDSVFIQEHEMRIHPLFANMRIAGDLYAIQQLASREVIWEGGIDCAQRSQQGWRAVECGQGWAERLNQLGALRKAATARSDSPDTMSDQDRAQLEALGYVEK